MSEKTQPKSQNDEVDLGQIFKMIGKAFQKLYDLIISILKSLFYVLMLILTHVYKRFKWYAIAVVLGIVLGYFLDKSSDKLYGANMFIETNFKSAYQVYENIKNLNELAGVDKDYKKLAEILEITNEEASNFRGFYIKPSIDENDRVKKYSNYKKEIDSVARAESSYKDYINGLNNYSFKTHQIGVVSIDKSVFPKLNKNFAETISQNDYLNSLLQVEKKNYDRKEETLLIQDKKIDELVEQYLEIRKRQSDKQNTPISSSGTNILLGDSPRNDLLVNEAALLKEKITIANQLRQTAFNKVENNDIISVISYFPSSGYSIQEWYEKAIVIYPIIFVSVAILIFIFLGLSDYIKKHEA